MRSEKVGDAYAPYIAQYGLGDIPRANLRIFHYDRGEYVCHAGVKLSHLLLIIRGKVRVSVTGTNGKSLLYCINVDKGIMGSIELLTGAPATASGEAITPVSCLSIPIAENLAALQKSLSFMNYLCRELSIIFERASRNNAANILYPLQTRLCSYIAMTAEDGRFAEKLTDVNALLGTSYRHLLRTLDSLCGRGILRKLSRGYAIADKAALEALAEGYYDM